MKILLLFILLIITPKIFAQNPFYGQAKMGNKNVPFAVVLIKETNKLLIADSIGRFSFPCVLNNYTIRIESSEIESQTFGIECRKTTESSPWIFHLHSSSQILDEVVISGSLKEVDKLKTTVPVEIYSGQFFTRNPSASILENLSQINGIRPQINCNICNTGDIHMNGLEGPYTLVLIDGMPIISSLASVYGLSGIPTSLIERIEVVRGPSAVLYGSEAIGGMINIITKDPGKSAKFVADVFSTTWSEWNTELSMHNNYGKKTKAITGLNYFHYDNPIDNNKDGFTDLTVQKRLSIFHKLIIPFQNKNQFSLGARYVYEDRWGGQINWTPQFRGTDSIYAESIYTNRIELIGKYDLPTKERISLSGSFSNHRQNSYYGLTSFMAEQRTFFGQLSWFKEFNRNELVAGLAIRSNHYDDNTFATQNGIDNSNSPQKTTLPGVFAQNEFQINEKHKLLFGARYDYSFVHGSILTPRVGYKFDIKKHHLIRLNSGTGYRVVNVFTEDHAALTGARTVVFTEELQPERSFNINLNYNGTFFFKNGTLLKLDFSPFYSYFMNKITPDYLTDVTKIIYANSNGYAESKGVSFSIDYRTQQWKINIGLTVMDVSRVENNIRERQLLTERISGTWTFSYSFENFPLEIDYTGTLYGPMNLPLQGTLDPRPEMSPWWSIQNVQFRYKGFKQLEIYTGVKNLLNWVPGKDLPFLIARAHDPFDKEVSFNSVGQPSVTPTNPYGLTFDPTYVYAPNQGIRFLFGLRYHLK